MAKIYHPDNVETGDIEKFRELDEKYKILSNLETRDEHDTSLRFEQSMEYLRNNSSTKMFHFDDSYNSELEKSKESYFHDYYEGETHSSNTMHDYFKQTILDEFEYNMGVC